MKIKFKILNIIYICIVLNLIPMALLGLLDISYSLYTILYAVVYIIQSGLLFLSLCVNLKIISKRHILLFLLSLINSSIALLFDIVRFGNLDYNEILFIISSSINILFLIIGTDKKEITLNELYDFLKKLCFIGIISVIVNFILNYKSIFKLSAITNSYNANFSSFFPNRNQFGLFMLLMIISLSLLMNIKFKKKHILYFILFSINLVLSMSRNSILGFGVFCLMFFYYKYIKEKRKITKSKFLLYLLGMFLILIFIYICINISELYKIINTLFLRTDTIESGSGRFDVWKNGMYIALHNNPLFGVGRYKGLELNKLLFNSNLEYFHSMYVEKFVTHGVIGIFILMLLLKFVWNKVNNILDYGMFKIILKSSLVSFWVISIFETTTRFSIGYADFMFLVFFFTIPILISNVKK